MTRKFPRIDLNNSKYVLSLICSDTLSELRLDEALNSPTLVESFLIFVSLMSINRGKQADSTQTNEQTGSRTGSLYL